MEWQQYVADVAGEVDPKTGLPVYREVDILVPRQSGKTSLLLPTMVNRALGYGGPQRISYAAQTGNDAEEKWREHVTMLEASPLVPLFKLSETNGKQAIRWANGSIHAPTATTTKSGHGKTLDLGVLDEAFAQIDGRVEQAMRPAMITRRQAQLFVVSTAGDATSVYLNRKIAEAHERLDADPDAPGRIAYFEWSADPDEDPGDPATWYKCMPALGNTVHVDDIRVEFDSMTERDFRRAFLNQTDMGGSADQVVDPNDWILTADEDASIIGTPSFALDITPDRSWSSVAVSGTNPGGAEHVELIKHERGAGWVIQYLVERTRRQGVSSVAVAASSQAAAMQEDLERAGLEVFVMSKADMAAACAGLYDGITNHTLTHLGEGQVPLDVAIAGASWTAGDARIWSHAKSTTDISPLYAVTLARHRHILTRENEYDVLQSIA
nr:terminase family protein [Herbiconiux sp. VKM Ac-2851]